MLPLTMELALKLHLNNLGDLYEAFPSQHRGPQLWCPCRTNVPASWFTSPPCSPCIPMKAVLRALPCPASSSASVTLYDQTQSLTVSQERACKTSRGERSKDLRSDPGKIEAPVIWRAYGRTLTSLGTPHTDAWLKLETWLDLGPGQWRS